MSPRIYAAIRAARLLTVAVLGCYDLAREAWQARAVALRELLRQAQEGRAIERAPCGCPMDSTGYTGCDRPDLAAESTGPATREPPPRGWYVHLRPRGTTTALCGVEATFASGESFEAREERFGRHEERRCPACVAALAMGVEP